VLVINKLSVGLAPLAQMFRVTSLSGEIADEIVVNLKEKPIRNSEFFTEFNSPNTAMVQLRNKERGNSLLVTTGNIVFTQERFGSHVDIDKFLEAFAQLWRVIDHVLDVQQIRRIGMVAEHRVFDVDDPSKVLVGALTKYPQPEYSGKFLCAFEKRIPYARAESPVNFKTGEFTNVIHQFYDSELDIDAPQSSAFNVNLDVQRYYSDLTGDGFSDEVKSLRKEFESQWREFHANLKTLGLIE
jgi:hypothetical protein